VLVSEVFRFVKHSVYSVQDYSTPKSKEKSLVSPKSLTRTEPMSRVKTKIVDIPMSRVETKISGSPMPWVYHRTMNRSKSLNKSKTSANSVAIPRTKSTIRPKSLTSTAETGGRYEGTIKCPELGCGQVTSCFAFYR
jgi:hypothetical protein